MSSSQIDNIHPKTPSSRAGTRRPRFRSKRYLSSRNGSCEENINVLEKCGTLARDNQQSVLQHKEQQKKKNEQERSEVARTQCVCVVYRPILPIAVSGRTNVPRARG